MINQCPACDSPVIDTGALGHCTTCGWEFVSFATSFELGQQQMQARLNIARNYLHQLREGTEEIKQEIAQLRGDLQSTRESVEQKEVEISALLQKNETLKVELEQAISAQNYITISQNHPGSQKIDYWASKNGDIHIESEQPVSRLPPMMMVIKHGDVPVADPKFGTDGTYAAMINPILWRNINPYTFTLGNSQLFRVFPCLSGFYTFSLASTSRNIDLRRKGNENDISNVLLKF